MKAIVAKFFNLPCARVRLDAAFVDDLGADALDMVELVAAFEAEFGVVISRLDLASLVSARSVVTYLRNR